MFGTVKEALRGRRFSSDEEVISAMQNLLKTQPKTFLLTELKKNIDAGTGVLKWRGITLKSNINFVFVYFTINVLFFAKSLYFLTYPRTFSSRYLAQCIYTHTDLTSP
jgi:hypothetical protein